MNPRQHSFTLRNIHLTTGDFLVEQRRRMRFALFGSSKVDVLEHHLDTRRGADKSDPRAHHPGAEHADLTRNERRKALRPRASCVDFVELKQNVPIRFFEIWPVVNSVK